MNALGALLPRPRRPVTIRSALPLAIFLAASAAAWIAAEARGLLLFASPSRLLLLPPAAAWVWWMHEGGYAGLSGIRAEASLLFRLVLVGLTAATLAEPRSVRREDRLALVYALDLSDSVGERALEGDGRAEGAKGFVVRTVREKPEKDLAGLVVFGRTAAVEMPPRMAPPFKEAFETIVTRVPRDGTNLEKAVSLAAAMVPEENPGRIVLVSDGVQTEGNVSGILDDLKARGIPVDVLPVDYAFPDEVWLERLELPRIVKAGETYEAVVILSSLKPGRGTLVLRENGEKVVFRRDGRELLGLPVEFQAGKNRYTVPFYLRGPGHYEYSATIEVDRSRDGRPENNTVLNYLYLKGEGKVLLVTDPHGDPRDWQPLAKALRESKLVVEDKPAAEFPRDPLALLPYDCVILQNVPADEFDAVQLQAIRDAVYNQGQGLLMVGGKNAFGPGGYHRTPVEEALPVSMDITSKKVLPKGALSIVLHTCEFADGNTWAKRIAKAAIAALGAQDEAEVLEFGPGGDHRLFPLTPASEYERLVTLINGAQPEDMPSFQPTMQMGLQDLQASDAAAKHMIIISDGDPSAAPPLLVRQFITAQVSVTCVEISPHGGPGGGPGPGGQTVMQQLSAATGGNYYSPTDPRTLPQIFVKEAKTLKRSMIQNKTFTPEVEMTSPILKGIGKGTIPPLKGYVITTPKPWPAATILAAPDKEEKDPILAVWQHGLGKAAAFTSDLSANWAGDWLAWERYQSFAKQLVTEVKRVEQESDLRMEAYGEGDKGVLVVEDQGKREGAIEVEAQVTGPGRRTERVRLRPIGPRRYQGEFPLWGKGTYQVLAAGAGEGRQANAVGGFAAAYSPEYLRFRSNLALLREIAARTGGRVLAGREEGKALFGRDRRPKDSSRPIVDLALLLLACLVPLDVAIRRIQIDFALIRGWLGLGRKATAEGTLGALLQRKQQIAFARGEGRADRPMGPAPGPPLPAGGRPAVPAPPAKGPAPPAAPPAAPSSTMERLLEAKRRAQKPGSGS